MRRTLKGTRLARSRTAKPLCGARPSLISKTAHPSQSSRGMLKPRLGTAGNRWLLAAMGEVVLIFFGITLAIAFDNWSSERSERAAEHAMLLELEASLAENVQQLSDGLIYNRARLSDLRTLIEHLDEGRPYAEELEPILGQLDNWDSPYLVSGAYETLKARGFDLISDAALRNGLIRVFEGRYAVLVRDWDRAEWINYENSMSPLMIAHVEEAGDSRGRPTHYDRLLGDRGFKAALYRSAALRERGIELTQAALRSTAELLEMIGQDEGLGAT